MVTAPYRLPIRTVSSRQLFIVFFAFALASSSRKALMQAQAVLSPRFPPMCALEAWHIGTVSACRMLPSTNSHFAIALHASHFSWRCGLPPLAWCTQRTTSDNGTELSFASGMAATSAGGDSWVHQRVVAYHLVSNRSLRDFGMYLARAPYASGVNALEPKWLR